MKKRFLFILALALTSLFSVFMLSSCCFPVDGGDPSATQGLEYELNEDGESYYLKGIGTASGEIVIASTYNKKPVTAIGDEAFISCDDVTSIMIPDSVTGIGEWAFYKCTGLKSVTIPDSVTSIGDDAFYECTGLTGVYITDIASWCKISFGNYEANPLIYANKLYLNGTLVTDLVIPDSVTIIGNYAFSNCDGLKSVTIPYSVTSIGDYAFYGCTGLTSVTIGNSVTSIGAGAFRGCERLSEVTFEEVSGWQVNGNDLHIDTIANQREVATLLKDSVYSWHRN